MAEPAHPTHPVAKIVGEHPRLIGSAAVSTGLLAVLVVVLETFDWNMARGALGRMASSASGRDIRLTGDLKVHLFSWTPSASIGGLKIGNPQWAGPGDTATADRVILSVKLGSLLTGHPELPLFRLDHPVLNLVRDDKGRGNWALDPARQGKPARLPPIQRFIINNGQLGFRDTHRNLTIDARIDTHENATDASAKAFALTGKGAFNRKPFILAITGGPLINVRPGTPYPFNADVRSADTHLMAHGVIPKPFDLAHFEAALEVSGPDLSNLYDLTSLALPNTPPYRLAGRLTRNNTTWDFERVRGRIGATDLAGRFVVNRRENREVVTANFTSRQLDIKDLVTLFGAPPVGSRTSKTATPLQKVTADAMMANQRLMPDAPLAVDRMRKMDAVLKYRAASVKSAFVPLRSAALDLKLDHGVLDLNPIAFDLPQGAFRGVVRLDARGDTPVTDADLRLNNISLAQFLPKAAAGTAPAIEGVLAARVKLHGVGDSVHKAAAGSSGAVTIVMPGGKLRQAFAELLGINVGRGLYLLLSKSNKETGVRCAVADFRVSHGVLTPNRAVFDTDVVKGDVKGRVDLGTETLDLRVEGHPKRAQFLHLMAPILIKGHLRSPTIGVDTGKAVAQGGVAVALGVLLTPLAAILPFVDPGLGKNADCASLVADAKRGDQSAAPVKASQLTAKPRPR